MTTTASGGAAVARLNRATEAFEKIITGASNQVVDVPGYGNQPTLAARVDQRLDETTATAAAEANRSRDEADRSTNQATAAANSVTLATAEYNKAKTQADRAQSEADRASQISGLDNVAEAVGLAAIPFPDVWIPLSDSLRMLAGYGREVKVGDDVVARYATLTRNTTATMVNKSQLLTNAAINEARFEREGVLVEVLGRNLIKWSAPTTAQPGLTSIGRVIASYTDDGKIIFTVSEETSSQWAQVQVVGLDAQAAGVAYSGSVWLSASVAGEYRLNLTSRPFGGGAESSIGESVFVHLNETPRRVSISEATVGNEGQIGIRVSWSQVGNVGDSVTFHRAQLEASRYVTSYIPTSGAAATRAADKLTIPRLNNDCAEWYSGPDQINPIVTEDTIELVPPAGKLHLRNVRGFFTPLTPAQKAALK